MRRVNRPSRDSRWKKGWARYICNQITQKEKRARKRRESSHVGSTCGKGGIKRYRGIVGMMPCLGVPPYTEVQVSIQAFAAGFSEP